jgi:hypothetical protein
MRKKVSGEDTSGLSLDDDDDDVPRPRAGRKSAGGEASMQG